MNNNGDCVVAAAAVAAAVPPAAAAAAADAAAAAELAACRAYLADNTDEKMGYTRDAQLINEENQKSLAERIEALDDINREIEEAAAVAASAPTIVAVGINCTDPRYVTSLVERVSATTTLPAVVYPNAGGDWDPADGEWHGAAADPGGGSDSSTIAVV
mgnify:CR=1 FL=1